MKILLITIILFSFTYDGFSCSCKTITKSDNFNHSALVFLGEVLQKESEHYIVKPIEVFKGANAIMDTIFLAGYGDCLINPDVGETWLIYANLSDTSIIISNCGHSRSYEYPYDDMTPPPPPPYKRKRTSNIIENQVYYNNALNQLLFDIQSLRSRKFISDFDKNNEKLYKQIEFSKRLLLLIIAALIILILLKVKNSNTKV